MGKRHIRLATLLDVDHIHGVAVDTWEPTYRAIISQEQISTMFEDLLSKDAIRRQIEHKEGTYVLALEDDQAVGFAYFSANQENPDIYKLHRLYVRPTQQSGGVGSDLLHWVENYLHVRGVMQLVLNVNRFNSAQHFYRKLGYEVIETVDIPYRQFWLNDYVMKKALQ